VAFVALAFVAVEAKDALTETDYQNFVGTHSQRGPKRTSSAVSAGRLCCSLTPSLLWLRQKSIFCRAASQQPLRLRRSNFPRF
jgi:hypothetical protein